MIQGVHACDTTQRNNKKMIRLCKQELGFKEKRTKALVIFADKALSSDSGR
jgi:hypothetical protein